MDLACGSQDDKPSYDLSARSKAHRAWVKWSRLSQRFAEQIDRAQVRGKVPHPVAIARFLRAQAARDRAQAAAMTSGSPIPAENYEISAREADAMAADFGARSASPSVAPPHTLTVSGQQLEELRSARGRNVDLNRLRAGDARADSGSSAD
jgi:hypothetical protein